MSIGRAFNMLGEGGLCAQVEGTEAMGSSDVSGCALRCKEDGLLLPEMLMVFQDCVRTAQVGQSLHGRSFARMPDRAEASRNSRPEQTVPRQSPEGLCSLQGCKIRALVAAITIQLLIDCEGISKEEGAPDLGRHEETIAPSRVFVSIFRCTVPFFLYVDHLTIITMPHMSAVSAP